MDSQKVKVAGWVHEKRKFGGLLFVLIRDRDGIFQVTLPKKYVAPEVFEAARSLSRESVVHITGTL